MDVIDYPRSRKMGPNSSAGKAINHKDLEKYCTHIISDSMGSAAI